MKLFNKYPTVKYKFGTLKTFDDFTDLSRYADIIDQVKDDTTTYNYYQIQDGERPDVVSHRLYGSEIYGWTFWILNDHIRDKGWPLSYQDFRDYLEAALPGECLVVNGTSTHSETGITCHSLTENFPIGSLVYGSASNAQGVVYMRNLNLGQLFVRKTNNTEFLPTEAITDTIAGTPNYTAVLNSQSLAYEAAHHYLNSDEEIIDIDPTTGIVPAGYVEVTHEEYLQDENDELSRIKVLKPSLISRFASLYKDTINR